MVGNWNKKRKKPADFKTPWYYIGIFFQVKVEWTEQLVARQKQETEKIRKETQNIKAILDAERERQVQAIATSKHIGRYRDMYLRREM